MGGPGGADAHIGNLCIYVTSVPHDWESRFGPELLSQKKSFSCFFLEICPQTPPGMGVQGLRIQKQPFTTSWLCDWGKWLALSDPTLLSSNMELVSVSALGDGSVGDGAGKVHRVCTQRVSTTVTLKKKKIFF